MRRNDYYPFGMQMAGRKFTAAGSGYRYGFNGKENDNEVKGEGNQQDYGMRIYDPRIAKFLSTDPVTDKYPELTPYQFASNRPIDGIDLDGLEWWKKIIWAISPILGGVSDKEVSSGFTERAMGFVHSLKNLPSVAQKFFDANGKLGTPGGAFVKNQEFKQKAFNAAFAQGSIESFKEIYNLAKQASKGDKKAIGALGFEAMLLIIPGGEEASGIKFGTKSLKFLGEVIPIVEKSIVNKQGNSVLRILVRNEDDLLKVAEDAAGGSLDNLSPKSGNINGTWWEGDVHGQRTRIEWEPGGHPELNEGPHVRVQKWIDGSGKKGKGKWNNGDKYFIQGKETLRKSK